MRSRLEAVRRFDVFTKVQDDLRESTSTGAVISIISGILMFMLFVGELNAYVTPTTKNHFRVDASRRAKFQINLDLTFPTMPCSDLNLDAIDASGEQQIDVVANMFKRRLDASGAHVEQQGQSAKIGHTSQECGSCYGAETFPGQCCNSCGDVRRAFAEKGFASVKADATEQCIEEKQVREFSKQHGEKGEGCQIYGSLLVNKVAGNFHFAPGRSYEHGQMHIHEFVSAESMEYNVSHVVNRLSFGVDYPGRVNPLDATRRIVPSGQGIVNYFIKIVPTIYQPLRQDAFTTNQFSVTEHFRDLRQSQTPALPGIFFAYDLSAIMAEYKEYRNSFPHFLTNVCAIIGGVFTVAGIVDSLIYHMARTIQSRKRDDKL